MNGTSDTRKPWTKPISPELTFEEFLDQSGLVDEAWAAIERHDESALADLVLDVRELRTLMAEGVTLQ